MNQDTIVEALGKHLDALQTILNSIILLAVATAWAGISRQQEIEALGMKFRRRHAFFAASGLYLIANMAVLILFLRIGDLFALLDSTHLVTGLSTLATHTWILNPFGYFGPSALARLHSGEGFGLLIVTWWLCNASLYTLGDKKQPFTARVLLGTFLGIGLLSMLAVQRDYAIIVSHVGRDPLLAAQLTSTITERTVGTFLGIAIGGLSFTVISRLHDRWIQRA
jgi:hypothetical protein